MVAMPVRLRGEVVWTGKQRETTEANERFNQDQEKKARAKT